MKQIIRARRRVLRKPINKPKTQNLENLENTHKVNKFKNVFNFLGSETTIRKKEEMLRALDAKAGVVAVACRAVGITRQIHYIWLKEDENYAKEVDTVAQLQLEFVEAKLMQKIQEGDTRCIIYYLKKKGGSLGYTENKDTSSSAYDNENVIKDSKGNSISTKQIVEILKEEDKIPTDQGIHDMLKFMYKKRKALGLST